MLAYLNPGTLDLAIINTLSVGSVQIYVMQDFSVYYFLATVACIALAVWLRIRLFGNLDSDDSARMTPACVPLPADELEVQVQTQAQAQVHTQVQTNNAEPQQQISAQSA